MSKNELRSSGERRRRGFANGRVNSNVYLKMHTFGRQDLL